MELETNQTNSLIFSIEKQRIKSKEIKSIKDLKRIRNKNWTQEENKLLISLYTEKRRKKWVNIAK